MKKLIFSFVVVSLVMFGSVFAYADSFSEAELTITSDFDLESDKVSTFDDEKTISGTAPAGTMIQISLSAKNFAGVYKQNEFIQIEVGTSEFFSQVLELKIGENLIEMTGTYDDEVIFEGETVVSRKNRSIKVQLEKGIYIPGSNL